MCMSLSDGSWGVYFPTAYLFAHMCRWDQRTKDTDCEGRVMREAGENQKYEWKYRGCVVEMKAAWLAEMHPERKVGGLCVSNPNGEGGAEKARD